MDEEILERLEFHACSTFAADKIDTAMLQLDFEDLVNDFLFKVNILFDFYLM